MRNSRCWMTRSMREVMAFVGLERKRLRRFSGFGALVFLGFLAPLLELALSVLAMMICLGNKISAVRSLMNRGSDGTEGDEVDSLTPVYVL